MSKYTVHLYPVVRVEFVIEAESEEEAIDKAVAESDFEAKLTMGEIEYAEEDAGYCLVDEHTPEGHEIHRTRWFSRKGQSWVLDTEKL